MPARHFFLLFCLVALSLPGCTGSDDDALSAYTTSIVVPPVAATSAKAAEQPVDFIVVQKKSRVLSLWKSGRLLKTYPIMALGDNPIGQKVYEGDERTPEGQYYIDDKHPSSNFQKFLRISYPNDHDKELAKRFGMPPGGNVGIHGDRGGWDGFVERSKKNWTDGCLAMRNADISEIYDMVSVGTPILIKP
jgi:murein L,D-transpeptidase YafK